MSDMPEADWPGEWPLRVYILHPDVKSFGDMVTAPERREYISADKVAALVSALDDVADECTSDEIPEGYGPDMTESPEFHRGYDAALHRVRRALAMFRGDAKP